MFAKRPLRSAERARQRRTRPWRCPGRKEQGGNGFLKPKRRGFKCCMRLANRQQGMVSSRSAHMSARSPAPSARSLATITGGRARRAQELSFFLHAGLLNIFGRRAAIRSARSRVRRCKRTFHALVDSLFVATFQEVLQRQGRRAPAGIRSLRSMDATEPSPSRRHSIEQVFVSWHAESDSANSPCSLRSTRHACPSRIEVDQLQTKGIKGTRVLYD